MMAAANVALKFNFISEANETHHEQNHVKISYTAKFQVIGQTRNGRHSKTLQMRDKRQTEAVVPSQ